MANDPDRDNVDTNDGYNTEREESITTELDDVELVDPEAPPTVAGLMNNPDEPPAPDPAEITARISGADVDALVGEEHAETKATPKASTLAERLKFEGVQRPKPTPRPRSAAMPATAPVRRQPPEPAPSFLGRLFGKLFGKRG